MKPERFKKPAPAARDATANIRPSGPKGYKPGEIEGLASTGDYWDKVTGETAPPGRYAAGDRAARARAQIPDAQAREAAAEKTKSDLGLQLADYPGQQLEHIPQETSMFRGRMRGGEGGRNKRFNTLGMPSERTDAVSSMRKEHGRDVRPAKTRQGSSAGNKKMGRADDVDAPVKGDGSPHIQR